MTTPCSTYSKSNLISTNSTVDEDLTQHMIDSFLSLTPLINANLTILNGEEAVSMSAAKQQVVRRNSTTVPDNEEMDPGIRIKRVNDDSHISFPSVPLNQRKLIEFLLTNQAETFVNWRAFSLVPASLFDGKTTYKSSYNTFSISPQSGVIPPLQKQSIKIEFSPRDAIGLFSQTFQIETRTDPSIKLNDTLPQISYSCNLVLRGISCQQLKREITMSSSNLSLASTNVSTSSSITSDSSTLSSSGSIRKVTIKTEPIVFENTRLNEISKAEIFIQNKESFDCKINILPIQEPFFLKHTKTTIISMRCIKIPIEFRPTHVRDFKDKVIIRVEGYDSPLSCLVAGRCVP